MKLTNLASTTVLVENKDTKILCDPWLVDGEYYGSWYHYPPLKLDFSSLREIDYIYVSHIHPDHMSKKTLEKFDKNIPVLIHAYDSKFLKFNIEKTGFKVIELAQGEKYSLGSDLNITVYAADNCDPAACYKYFGCAKMEKTIGSTQIDTMAVIDNGKNSILNVNDCPYPLSEITLDRVLSDFPSIDLLLVGHTGAGSYPQCWPRTYNEEELIQKGKEKSDKMMLWGKNFIDHVRPKAFMPFAGMYVLGGKLHKLEKYKGAVTIEEALDNYQKSFPEIEGILLNHNESYNLKYKNVSKKYIPLCYEKMRQYVTESLADKKYDYEEDPETTLEEIQSLLEIAYSRFEAKRKELNFETSTNVYMFLPEEKMAKISCSGHGYEIINVGNFNDDKYVSYKIDYKLLKRILKGPQFAHWNNAEIGSHIEFDRKPDIHERYLYYCINFFHQ